MADFFIRTVLLTASWIGVLVVKSHPLGLGNSEIDISNRPPSYLPTHSGFFSANAVNFTPSTTHRLTKNHLTFHGTENSNDDAISSSLPNITFEPVVEADQSRPPYADSSAETGQSGQENSRPSDGTEINELEWTNTELDERLRDPHQTSTFHRTQVVTKTIIAESSAVLTSPESTVRQDEGLKASAEGLTANAEVQKATARPDDSISKELPVLESEVDDGTATRIGETLLEGSNSGPVEATDEETDIFDRLMRTIQGHWMDFVGKMKLSVLDVWKSISKHMMDKLENFATTI